MTGLRQGSRGPLPKGATHEWLAGRGERPAELGVKGKPRAATARTPRVPEGMGTHGTRLWKKLYPELREAGLMTENDESTFALLCRAYDVATAAYIEVASSGVMINGHRGVITKNPLLQIARDFSNVYERLAGRFGLHPEGAARLGLESVGDDE